MLGFFHQNKSPEGTWLQRLLEASIANSALPFYVNCVLPGSEGIVYANQSMIEFLGVKSFNDLKGLHVSNLFHGDQGPGRTIQDLVVEVESQIKQAGRWAGCAFYQSLNTKERVETVATVNMVVLDDKPYGIVFIEDVKKTEAAVKRKRELEELASTFQSQIGAVVEKVSAVESNLGNAAKHLSSGIEKTAKESSSVDSASAQTSDIMQSVAQATERLAQSIGQIGDQAEHSTTIARDAVEKANFTQQTVANLNDAAAKIGDVIKLIQDIASQTNLLALNATIEAARAGDAGKGFAVVANEVKSLANQTAQATEDIATQIVGIQGATQQTVGAIQAIAATIQQVNDISNAIAVSVQAQREATQEIAGNVSSAASGAQSIRRSISLVNDAVNDSVNASTLVEGASSELSVQSNLLNHQIDHFLSTLRQKQ